MNYNSFYIDDGHFEIPKEQMAKIAKDLQENSPMHDINKHYKEEISLLNAMMVEIKEQAKDSDKKHKQAMTKAN